MNSPIVTDTDRQRGWAEIEIELLDGTRQFVRVHALNRAEYLRLAKHSPADALSEGVATALRVDKQFVTRICPEHLVAVSAIMFSLKHGDVAGEAMIRQAATSDSESSKSNAMSALADTMELGKQIRELHAAWPKLPEFPKLSPELRSFLSKSA